MTDPTKTQLSGGVPLAYDVIGFAPLRVISEKKNSNTFSLKLEWTGATSCGEEVIGPPATGTPNAFQLDQ